jgi:BlaI family transcriptional regulator, penicillinase repressor
MRRPAPGSGITGHAAASEENSGPEQRKIAASAHLNRNLQPTGRIGMGQPTYHRHPPPRSALTARPSGTYVRPTAEFSALADPALLQSSHVDPYAGLSRRERQIMSILHRRGRATAVEVQADLPDPPGYSAVRSALALMVERGVVRHERDGNRFVYFPALPRERARSSAVRHLLRTFFGGSRKQAVSTLLEDEDFRISDEEYRELLELLEEARQRGEGPK